MNMPEELSKLVEELKNEMNLIRGVGVTDARYLQVVNATSVPFTIGVFASYPALTPNPLPIGNVAAKFTTLPIDLTNWIKPPNRTCRLAIRRSGSAWVTFDGSFYFTSDAANTTKAAFQVSSLGTWSCTGPHFGPIIATKSSANKDDELADIPGDPLEL